MSETLLTAIVTALISGAVNWGVLSTKLAWMRHDIERIEDRLSQCEARHFARRGVDL